MCVTANHTLLYKVDAHIKNEARDLALRPSGNLLNSEKGAPSNPNWGKICLIFIKNELATNFPFPFFHNISLSASAAANNAFVLLLI